MGLHSRGGRGGSCRPDPAQCVFTNLHGSPRRSPFRIPGVGRIRAEALQRRKICRIEDETPRNVVSFRYSACGMRGSLWGATCVWQDAHVLVHSGRRKRRLGGTCIPPFPGMPNSPALHGLPSKESLGSAVRETVRWYRAGCQPAVWRSPVCCWALLKRQCPLESTPSRGRGGRRVNTEVWRHRHGSF